MELVILDKSNRAMYEQGLIECYSEVFRAPPWNEDWWTPSLVKEVLTKYSGDSVTLVLALEDTKVIGFCFGGFVTSKTLASELEFPLPYPHHQLVGYIKDVGVDINHRERGIAQKMLQTLAASLQQRVGKGPLLARTLGPPNPSVVYLWFPKLGFKTIAEYPKGTLRSGQVILAADDISSVSF